MANSARSGDGRYWSPVSLLQNQFGRLLDDFFGDLGLAPGGGVAGAGGSWMPAMDVDETENEFVVSAELPGVDPKDIQITVVGNALTIRGETREESGESGESGEKEQTGRRRHRRERRYGEFVRVLTLPSGVDTDAVRATHRHGLLEVHLQKRAEAKPKQIRVETEEASGPQGRQQLQGSERSGEQQAQQHTQQQEQEQTAGRRR